MTKTTSESEKARSGEQQGQGPLLSVLVVSYNTRALTLKALETFCEHVSAPYELIVVDNASTDGSAEAIAREFPEARLIQPERNLGFAGANNEAARHAQGDLLLLLNPDTETLPEAIDSLLKLRAEQPDAGVWGGRTLYADGSPNPSSCWKRQTLWSLFVQATGLSSLFRRSQWLNPERILDLREGAVLKVDIVSGCFLLIERSLFARLGGFAPRFFMYGEDADLCLRARDQGASPVVSGNAAIVHHGGASETVRADKLIRLLTAKATLIDVHFHPATRRIGLSLLAAWPCSRLLAHKALALVRFPGAAEKASAWSNVWARRKEWLGGFPEGVR